jgi:hypothetical protein
METYEELADAIAKMTPEQRRQKVQVVNSGSDETEPAVAQYCYSLGTVKELFETAWDKSAITEFQFVRDSSNGKHHSDAVVLLSDYSGYENMQVYEERRMLFGVVEKIAAGGHGVRPIDLARVALQKMAKRAEKKKTKMLKECC